MRNYLFDMNIINLADMITTQLGSSGIGILG